MPSYRSVSALTGKPGSDAEQELGDSCRTHRRRTRGNLTKYFIKIPFIPPCLNYYKVDGVTVKPVSALQSMFRCQFHPQENKTRQNKYDVIKEHKREKVQSLRLFEGVRNENSGSVTLERYVEICIRQISRRALVQGKICHKLRILPFFFFIKGLHICTLCECSSFTACRIHLWRDLKACAGKSSHRSLFHQISLVLEPVQFDTLGTSVLPNKPVCCSNIF